jgi:hypothetical protein
MLHIAVALKSDDCPPKSRPEAFSGSDLSGAHCRRGTDAVPHLFHAAFMEERVFFDRGSMRNAYSSIEVVDADKGKAGLCLRRKK